MVNNYYILKELSVYLNSELTGYVFSESFSQEKDKLIIILSDKKSGTGVKYLEFSCDRKIPFLILRQHFTKAKKNYARLFAECEGKEISGVSLLNDDRIIQVKLSDKTCLAFNFIPFNYNVLYYSETELLKSFKSNDELIGKSIDSLFRKIVMPFNEKIISSKTFLKTQDAKLGEIYIKEILARSAVRENDDLNEGNRELIHKYYNEIIDELKNPQYILYHSGESLIMSLTKLRIMEDVVYEVFPDINFLVESYVGKTTRFNSVAALKGKLISDTNKMIKHLERKIENLGRQIKNSVNYNELMEFGNIILSNMDKISPGDTTIEYKDEEKNITYTVKLDKQLTPSQNAQKYFNKYKRQRNSIGLISRKLNNAENDLLKMKKKLNNIMNMDDYRELKKERKKEEPEKDDIENKHFRKFKLNEDFQVWVGKNAKSNDLLTFKYANQNDLWFHVRGFSGSHTVLKKSSKNLEFPKEIIKTAASIAAYYSKARNSGTIPVAYTERKYVKKSRGFKDGTVILEREKVVFVKPLLPYDE